eukprot:GFKZ01003756.1.p1 GENE.GFKZ01003756.1~~GFKZ01003756.1.p1  ORF type:complete len:349 (+),score=73.66 GFKZ01003756.1:327-1373(+)
MTDRLAELRQPHVSGGSSQVDDIEAGYHQNSLRQQQDAVLVKFNKEADAIDKVYAWANTTLGDIRPKLQDPSSLAVAEQQLDQVEKKLDAVRKRLKRMASDNKDLAAAGTLVPASLKIRVSRYTKLGKDFMAVTEEVQMVREEHKKVVTRAVKNDILHANPAVSEATVDRALETGEGLDAVLQPNTVALGYQLEDLRSRNDAIQKLSKNIVDLHQMFTDMSILVEGQQELINDIEYNVKEVKADTKKAAEELVIARKHQKSARKKKMCICVLVIIIIVGIAAAVIIPLGINNGWFGGGGSNNNNNNNGSNNNNSGSQQNPAPTPPGSASARRALANDSPLFFKSRWYD